MFSCSASERHAQQENDISADTRWINIRGELEFSFSYPPIPPCILFLVRSVKQSIHEMGD